ncbi:MAG TPA: hypothetical protein VF002_05140 [Gaiellaceae bacterium]
MTRLGSGAASGVRMSALWGTGNGGGGRAGLPGPAVRGQGGLALVA